MSTGFYTIDRTGGITSDEAMLRAYLSEIDAPGTLLIGDIKPILMWLLRKELVRIGRIPTVIPPEVADAVDRANTDLGGFL